MKYMEIILFSLSCFFPIDNDSFFSSYLRTAFSQFYDVEVQDAV